MSARPMILSIISGLTLLSLSPAMAQDSFNKPAYRYQEHHNFDVFYADFKTALTNNDQEAVFKMTHMPFVCHAIECGALAHEQGEDYDKSKDLSMRNKKEFLQKYHQVFTPRLADFMRGEFMGLDKIDADDEMSRDFYSPNERVLQSFYEHSDNNSSDVFSFIVNKHGHYQLMSIPYRP